MNTEHYLLHQGDQLDPHSPGFREVQVAPELRVALEQRVLEVQALHVDLVVRRVQRVLVRHEDHLVP